MTSNGTPSRASNSRRAGDPLAKIKRCGELAMWRVSRQEAERCARAAKWACNSCDRRSASSCRDNEWSPRPCDEIAHTARVCEPKCRYTGRRPAGPALPPSATARYRWQSRHRLGPTRRPRRATTSDRTNQPKGMATSGPRPRQSAILAPADEHDRTAVRRLHMPCRPPRSSRAATAWLSSARPTAMTHDRPRSTPPLLAAYAAIYRDNEPFSDPPRLALRATRQ